LNAKELRALAKVMQDFGLTYVKHGDLELSVRENVSLKSETQNNFNLPINAPISQSQPIKHENVELTSIMKLGDVELLDQLFPDHTDQKDLDS
jgi:hypothetical protein